MAEVPVDPHLILPVGTQVVVLSEVRGTEGRVVHPRGAVGVVVQSPGDYWHSYRVRFPDDFEAMFRRQELAGLAHYQRQEEGTPVDPLAEYDLYKCVIYRCVLGSRAYGLDDADSDYDLRGVHVLPVRLRLGQ